MAKRVDNRPRLLRLGDCLSQTLNVAVFNGDSNESVSGRAYRETMEGHDKWPLMYHFVNGLFFWQADHCKGAYLGDMARTAARLDTSLVAGKTDFVSPPRDY